MQGYPPCLDCRHRHEAALTCAAFPDGIPAAILLHGFDHCAAYPGDGGIRFEPRDDAAFWTERCGERPLWKRPTDADAAPELPPG